MVLKLVENILRKHLHNAAKEYEAQELDIQSVVTPYEVLWEWPDLRERQALARELTEAICGLDLSTLRIVPTVDEAVKFIRKITPGELVNDEEFLEIHAKMLIDWLKYQPKRPLFEEVFE